MSPHAAGLVLLVEDEPALRRPLELLLRNRSYEVITADAADTALALLARATPDAGIVDLQLKRGSGRDVIAQMPEDAPVIIFSGTGAASGQLERLRPRTRLVEKPASMVWLLDTLDQMLREARRVF